MTKWTETDYIEVKGLKEIEKGLVKISFFSKNFGSQNLVVSKEDYELFPLFKKYIGIFESSGKDSYLKNEEDETTLYTITSSLKRIFEGPTLLYEFKE